MPSKHSTKLKLIWRRCFNTFAMTPISTNLLISLLFTTSRTSSWPISQVCRILESFHLRRGILDDLPPFTTCKLHRQLCSLRRCSAQSPFCDISGLHTLVLGFYPCCLVDAAFTWLTQSSRWSEGGQARYFSLRHAPFWKSPLTRFWPIPLLSWEVKSLFVCTFLLKADTIS